MTVHLATRLIAKPWGRTSLPPPFVVPVGETIGEVWFEPPAALPDLLVKYIFTAENLSVQVHPSDGQTMPPGGGKEECWLVIDAAPDARLGIGFRRPLCAADLRIAALDGSIEELLEWYPVKPGDFFYIPAGTVHAIGRGVGLIEVQQNSDITYRLYDYGRPRELHLDAALAVAQLGPHDAALRRVLPARGAFNLVEGPQFRLDRLDGPPDAVTNSRYRGAPLLVVPISSAVRIDGAVVMPGECGLADSMEALEIGLSQLCLIAQDCR